MAGQQDYLSGKITAEQYNDGLAVNLLQLVPMGQVFMIMMD